MLEAILDLDNAAFIVGYTINLKSDFSKVHTRRGYFSLDDRLERRACQDLSLEVLLDLTLPPSYSMAVIFVL